MQDRADIKKRLEGTHVRCLSGTHSDAIFNWSCTGHNPNQVFVHSAQVDRVGRIVWDVKSVARGYFPLGVGSALKTVSGFQFSIRNVKTGCRWCPTSSMNDICGISHCLRVHEIRVVVANSPKNYKIEARSSKVLTMIFFF
jgi:hypothetical protein